MSYAFSLLLVLSNYFARLPINNSTIAESSMEKQVPLRIEKSVLVIFIQTFYLPSNPSKYFLRYYMQYAPILGFKNKQLF